MKKLLLSLFMLLASQVLFAQGYEYTQITTIESVVPGGLGRSRMVTTSPDGKLNEEKMENFFSLVGINFGNVQSNDIQIADKLTAMSAEGWELFTVTPGVYSADKSTGIFITRYLFRRLKMLGEANAE